MIACPTYQLIGRHGWISRRGRIGQHGRISRHGRIESARLDRVGTARWVYSHSSCGGGERGVGGWGGITQKIVNESVPFMSTPTNKIVIKSPPTNS